MKSFFQKYDSAPLTTIEGGERRLLAYKNIMPVEIRFTKGAKGALHSHAHEQYTYVVSGKFLFTCEGEEVEVQAGDSIYFAPNEEHGVICLEDGILLDMFNPIREDFITP